MKPNLPISVHSDIYPAVRSILRQINDEYSSLVSFCKAVAACGFRMEPCGTFSIENQVDKGCTFAPKRQGLLFTTEWQP
ncbi:hypothetical protein PN586_11730 [Parabacteroides merdae]|jgi:hypothetical protein|uniref:Uncharacterized protein n=1 Tax=Bacteroides intestinalis TaxID=329854 RepID=A0AB37M6Y3_9BACE|nr:MULTISPECIES: hypothetical protein [Bacteroidales]MDB8881561.1 hypothetical protein [Parabacteroides merdae]MDB8892111.1 hypothetical protein [Parabacteroides merdae]MDB8895972.1 hypothetical protein [Parabacteroides merdae]MDB8899455.1 hypothetical protein [Parabacteroides merdae]RHN01155.1 hypothetical protein DWZ32_23250 [Bacteroides intestinalis]